jgi:peptidoglycan/xylan/chitin deacetylase (PgdA/CDA1 family)
LRARFPHRPPPAILVYHRIAEETFDPWGSAVTPDHFREHLSWLANNRTVLPLRDFAELHRKRALPRDAIALTLDDGYACNATIAAPLLEEFQLPATLFLPVNFIANGGPFWWDELEDIILEHEGPTLTVEGEKVALGQKQPTDRQWKPWAPAGTPRQSAYYDIHVRLARMKPDHLAKAMEVLRDQARPADDRAPTKRPMTPDEVRGAGSKFVEFGSHALNHPWLPNLATDEQRHEISDSVDRCRALSGSRPSAFAYPFGMFDDRSERLVQEAGFSCACTTRDLAVWRGSSAFALPRLQVGDWDAAGLERMLAHARVA